MRNSILLRLLSVIGITAIELVNGRLTRSTYGLALTEPQFLPGTMSTLIQTARKIIGSNIEPESVIGEGISQTNEKDSEKLYNEAVSSAVTVYQKGMNDAAHNRLKQKEAVSSVPAVVETREPACSVMISGELALALDPKNIFDVDLLGFKITKNDLLFMTDIKNPETLVRNYSLDKIEAPLESVQNSRKCFRMYYEGNPVVMCAKSDENRNEIMNKITEAVFCKNSGISFSKIKQGVENTGMTDSSLGIPALTTKDLRWVEQIAKRQLQMSNKVQDNVLNWLKSRGTQHVVVKDSLGFNPKITVNGENVV